MTDIDDGHSPDTCNYRSCNASAPKGPCPFVADEPSPSRGLEKLAGEFHLIELKRKAELLDELADVLKRILVLRRSGP